MRRTVGILLVLIVAGAVGFAVWWSTHPRKPASEVTLHGNVDLRQVQLAFNNNERIAAVLVQEGDRVHLGELLARLDTRRLEPQVAQAAATVDAQRAVVERLHNGSRPQEIAEARANVEAARADATNARTQYQRLLDLSKRSSGQAVSQTDIDNGKAAADMAEARLAAQQKALDLAVLGPRKEEVAENEARLRSDEAQLAFLRQQLADAQLMAPVDAVVRTRLLEPGDMASPQKPVFSLAITSPKWIRAYVSEIDLGKLHPGMRTAVTVDSFPNRQFDGWIGFISPVAEFTPKTVEMDELRTSLVYEVRVFVKDPTDDLRLGMPATVAVALTPEAAAPSSVAPSDNPPPVGAPAASAVAEPQR